MESPPASAVHDVGVTTGLIETPPRKGGVSLCYISVRDSLNRREGFGAAAHFGIGRSDDGVYAEEGV